MSGPAEVVAQAPVITQESGESLANRRALRNARIRAGSFIALAVIAFLWASSSFGVTAKFSFWLQQRGGDSADLVTTVGVLWVAAGLASILVGVLQLVRGATFRWRRWLLLVIAPWVLATLGALINGKTATM